MRRSIAALVLIASGAGAIALGHIDQEPGMAAAARALIAALDTDQRATLVFPFESEERVNWHFIPRARKGLPLKAMNERQRALAVALLKTGLGEKGYTKAEAVRSLEDVLRAIEKRDSRDREMYFFTVFGEPGADTWGWRYEGHHLSQNWTIARGRPTATSPAFFGANPAEVIEGPMKGLRALPAEGDLAWALLGSLTETQRREAVIGDTAPNDIITGNSRKAAIEGNTGIRAASMTADQRRMLTRLIDEHAASQAGSLADGRMARARAGGFDAIRFAWMGATARTPGAAHYYRIQGTTFLIEYDNTQNGANHQHIVWRDLDGDFGGDMLGAHYASDPAHAGAAWGARR